MDPKMPGRTPRQPNDMERQVIREELVDFFSGDEDRRKQFKELLQKYDQKWQLEMQQVIPEVPGSIETASDLDYSEEDTRTSTLVAQCIEKLDTTMNSLTCFDKKMVSMGERMQKREQHIVDSIKCWVHTR
jgi:hypothetical protein